MSFSEKESLVPQGNYNPATRIGDIIFTAGMTPRKNGILLQTGKIKTLDQLEMYREAVDQAVANTVYAVEKLLGDHEEIVQIASLTVYINAEDTFQKHSVIADIASAYLFEKFGEIGIGARAAIGVSSLPGDAPIEIQLIACVK